MRFKVTLLLAIILSAAAAAGFYAAAAVPVSLTKESFFEGFNGIPWGADIRSLKDMVLVVEGVEWGNHYASYRRKRDPLRFGRLRIRSVTYKFTNGKFSSCLIPVSPDTGGARPNRSDMCNEIERIFGESNFWFPYGSSDLYWFYPKLEISMCAVGEQGIGHELNLDDKKCNYYVHLNYILSGDSQLYHFMKNRW